MFLQICVEINRGEESEVKKKEEKEKEYILTLKWK